MLENLHVKDLALIEEAEVSFGKGLNILSGETGAGKSIILGSVNLALGAKASSEVIRTGKESALVELTFCLNDEQIKKVRAMDLDVDDDGEVLLQRKIMAGKSVCRLNGETISVGQLKELAGVLLDMYGQHEHQSLLKSSTYSKMLDNYAGEEVSLYQKELKEELSGYRRLVSERDECDSDTSVRERQAQLLRFEIDEIENAALKEGEDEELEKRFRFLSNARKIMEAVAITHEATGYEGDASAGSLLGYGVGRLKEIASFDDDAEALLEELVSVESLLSDFNRSLSTYEDKLSFDEAEFASVEERLNLINKLKSKYGDSIEAILSSLEEKSDELCKLENYEEYLAGLDKDIDRLKQNMLAKCAAVSSLRRSAAGPLTASLKEAMEDLNFMDVSLEIRIVPDEERITENGYDTVEFLISLNTGEELRPMQNVASGGELSRIMLAFKSIFADKGDVPTLIFDEIDSGISGVTAYKVARKMESLSEDHQLICITHLPQIAAMADEHFLIHKEASEGRTVTMIDRLDEEGSVRELARMLGSDSVSESALENARDLKRKAKE